MWIFVWICSDIGSLVWDDELVIFQNQFIGEVLVWIPNFVGSFLSGGVRLFYNLCCALFLGLGEILVWILWSQNWCMNVCVYWYYHSCDALSFPLLLNPWFTTHMYVCMHKRDARVTGILLLDVHSSVLAGCYMVMLMREAMREFKNPIYLLLLFFTCTYGCNIKLETKKCILFFVLLFIIKNVINSNNQTYPILFCVL